VGGGDYIGKGDDERALVSGVQAELGGGLGAGAKVMLSLSATTKVYLRPGSTDLRQGFEALYQLARTSFGQDPLAGDQVFAFCNHRRTRLKLLWHDGTGLWLAVKRPDGGTFAWTDDGPVDPLTAAQLWAMVSGLEVSGWRQAWRRAGKKLAQAQKTIALSN
jgi:transposase